MLRMLVLAALFTAIVPARADAEGCMRHENSTGRQGPDGPGSFGPLQDTLTLGCLRFARVIGESDEPKAVLVDETGKEYVVEVGSYVGENTGRINSISSHGIRIVQLVKDEDGEYVEAVRFLLYAPIDKI